MGGRGRPVEAASEHGAVVDYGELVVELVALGEARGADALYLQWI